MRVQEMIVPDPMAVAITSMVKSGRKLYIGLTGGRNILAECDIDSLCIRMAPPMFPWATDDGLLWKIHNSLALDSAGRLIAGEDRNLDWDGQPGERATGGERDNRMLQRRARSGLPIDTSKFGIESLESWDRRTGAPGGHIVRYDPATGRHEDFGITSPLEYWHSMVYDEKRQRACGHTLPGNRFVVADLQSGQSIDHGRISRFCYHKEILAPDGRVFGAYVARGGQMRLFEYDPDKELLSRTETLILADPGAPVQGNVGMDAVCTTRRGEVYFGTVANALLFQLHWQDRRVEMLGQAPGRQRIATMCEGEDDVLYMTVGFPHARLVRYDTRRRTFQDLGPINTEAPVVYFHGDAWDDGVIYLGETDGFSASLYRVEL